MVSSPVTITEKYHWTAEGRMRVAAAIVSTLELNQRMGLHPDSVRELARLAEHRYHTSIGRYAAGQTKDPNRANCQVLKDLSPFIYRVTGFELKPDSRKIHRVIHVNLPDINTLDVPYWQVQNMDFTYRGRWRELVEMGTAIGKALEIPTLQPSSRDGNGSPWGHLLLKRFLKLPVQHRQTVGQLLGVPETTLLAMGGAMAELNKDDLTSLSEVIQDFLLRHTGIKDAEWDLERLQAEFPPESDLNNINTLEAISSDNRAISEFEAARLAAAFTKYGVEWAADELRARDTQAGRQLTLDVSSEDTKPNHLNGNGVLQR